MAPSLKKWSLACALGLCFSTAQAADHLDAPWVQADPSTDINDLYAFQSPADPNNTVLIMTVSPSAGPSSEFNPQAEYRFNIDNNGDAEADLVFQFTFLDARGVRNFQPFRFSRYTGSTPVIQITRGERGRTHSDATFAGGVTAAARLFDDPFFFDLDGFNNSFMFTGDDFFEGLNVLGIVLELPSSDLGGPNISVWATTSVNGEVIDRMGRPAINTVLIPSASKNFFNLAPETRQSAQFSAEMQASIEALNGGDSGTAATLTTILLPDVLTFDTSSSAGFLNGRQLDDDVIDAELNLLTNGAVTTDGVDANDVPFNAVFPYLADPQP